MSDAPPDASRDALGVVIVDDEPLAREGLAESVARLVRAGAVPRMAVAACAASAREGLAAIRAHRPEIALVDVQMPGASGLDKLAELELEATPAAVVMVTAFAEHALRAFGVRALDYLVKPVPEATLAASLRRAATRVAEVRALQAATELAPPLPRATAAEPYLRRLVIPERGHRLVIPVDEIEWIEGETYYVRVHTAERGRLLRERLGALADALDPARFFRSHRSAVVRLDAVREIRADGPYSASVVLASGARAPLSRDRVRALEALLRR